MNFIFDIGNVLVEFMPLDYLRRLYDDDNFVSRMNEVVFRSPDWLQMDHGRLSREEATKIFCEREPEHKAEIREIMQGVDNMFIPKPDSIKYLPGIKESGHKLYYLSNMQIEIRDYLLEKHEYLRLFDGGVFSCDVGYIKPAPEIYQILLDKYNLDPGECIFFDDMPENVAAAEKEGIKSIIFTSVDCLKDFL